MLNFIEMISSPCQGQKAFIILAKKATDLLTVPRILFSYSDLLQALGLPGGRER